MFTIIIRTLKDRLVTTLAYCGASVAFLWMYIALFPYIRDQAASLSELMDAYPKELMEAFGIKSLELQFAHLGSYLSTETFSLMFPIMLVALVVGFAGSALAGEVEKGTIELLLSQPISRVQLYTAKYLAGVKVLGAFTVVSVFGIIPFAAIYRADYVLADITRFWVVAFLFGLALLSLSFLASSIFSDKGKPAFIVTGIVILMFVLNILASLKPSLIRLRDYSFFHYYDPTITLAGGAIDSRVVWVFLGVSVVATTLGAIWFTRRDITTA